MTNDETKGHRQRSKHSKFVIRHSSFVIRHLQSWLWRSIIGIVVLFVVALPVLFPFAIVFKSRLRIPDPDEIARIFTLGGNTAVLVLGTVCISLPVGLFLAALLFRTDLPFRRVFFLIVVSSLFIPLPFLTTTWQAVLGEQSWLSLALWPSRAGQPWASGLIPAITVHSLAAVPWVVLLIGMGLCSVERELEEEACLAAHPFLVFCRMTLPRCWPAIVIAIVWAAVLTIGEIAVTDMFMVRTFAEEVYLVLNEGGEEALGQILAPVLVATICLWVFAVLLLPFLLNRLPPMASLLRPVWLLRLGWFRWPCFLLCVFLVLLLVSIPVATMIALTGYQSDIVGWSWSFFISGMEKSVATSQAIVGFSLFGAILVGLATAFFALLVCWAAAGVGPIMRVVQITLCCFFALVWLTPGPVIGFGLKGAIQAMVLLADDFGQQWVAALLWDGPSYLPTWWACLIRALPYAVALLWPVVQMIPPEIRDAARADGAGPLSELFKIVLPISLPGILSAAALTAALGLAETSASKIVATPGSPTFSQVLFDRMHYGVTQDVSSLCLLLLVWVFVFLGIVHMLVMVRLIRHPSSSVTNG